MKLKQIVVVIALAIVGFGGLFATQTAYADTELQCTVLPQDICGSANSGDLETSGTWKILLLILNIMTALVGVVAVGALGFAGFLYATAMDDSSKVKKAKDMILNTSIGIGAYALMYVALNFLVPGGVFNG